MKRILDNGTLKAAIGAWLIFVFTGISFAGLSVSPLKQDVEVKPGKKTTISIKLGNNKRSEQAQACHVSLEVLDFKVSPDGNLSFGKEYASKRSAVSWIKFEETDIVLQPDESKEVKATVTAPADGDGDYWAAVMIKQVKDKAEKGVTVNLQTASGIFVHVTRRNYVEQGKIADANIILPEFGKDQNEAAADVNDQKGVLEIKAKVQNEGLIGFEGRGKTYIYSDKNRRIAAIPLHASRKQVLPGDSRWFDGVLDQPLPAGDYKVRIFFGYNAEFTRQITKEMKISISEEMAKRWAGKFVNSDKAKLNIKPATIELNLSPRRLTTSNFVVGNNSLGTIAGNCKIECDGKHKEWIGLKSSDFTLAPASEKSITCVVKIPEGTKAGEYNWTIAVQLEKSGLDMGGKSESYKIPVHVVVNEPVDMKRN